MTEYSIIFKSFLAKVDDDQWACPEDFDSATKDWLSLLQSALVYFKFPRFDIYNRSEDGFVEDLTEQEIEVISTFMKVEWLERQVLGYENLRPQYDEADFSHANLVDKLNKLKESTFSKARDLESRYYRSIRGRSFKYSKLAGGG